MARNSFNPLTYGRFSDPFFKWLWEGIKLFFSLVHPQQKEFEMDMDMDRDLIWIFWVEGSPTPTGWGERNNWNEWVTMTWANIEPWLFDMQMVEPAAEEPLDGSW